MIQIRTDNRVEVNSHICVNPRNPRFSFCIVADLVRAGSANTGWAMATTQSVGTRVPTQRGCEKIEPGGQCVRKPVLGFSHTLRVQFKATRFVV